MLDGDASPGQISKLLAFDIIIRGHSKSTFNAQGGGDSLKSKQKWTGGAGVKPICTFALWKKLPDFPNSIQSSFW